MPVFSMHPRPDTLSDFLAGDDRRPSLVRHVERCPRCQDTLRLLRAVRDDAGADVPAPPDGLLARALATRAAGGHVVLPAVPETPPLAEPARRTRWPVAAAAAVVLAALGLTLTTHRDDVEAGTTTGTLRLSPAAPKRGQAVTVRYQPAAMLAGRPWLALRARVRSPDGESYNSGIPITTLARLRRGGDGAYSATVTLPDSVVYAALAVEDSAAAIVDDNAGRAWEVVVAAPGGRPLLEALDQRAHDMMGRNWEEGFATVRRMVALYPDDLRSWNWLSAHQSWLGRTKDDTVTRVHRARVAEFDARLRRAARPSGEDMGRLAWYARGVDSAVAARWRSRLMREAPANSFAVQWRLFDVLDTLRATRDTAAALPRLDALWAEAPRDRREQVARIAYGVARGAGDTLVVRRWADRIVEAARDRAAEARQVATLLARHAATRAEGMRRIRAGLAALDTLAPAERGLTETLAEQRARHAADQRDALAALGRALVADGQVAAGLDTLTRATATGWSLETFRAVRAARLAAGDSVGALRVAARIAVDPRADSALVDSVRRRVTAAELDAARADFATRMLDGAPVRSLRGAVELRDGAGVTHDLRALAGGRITVVAFWSRFCFPAIEDLPRQNALAARLASTGGRLVSIVEETGPSPELTAFLKQKGVTVPTYFDPRHQASRAFNQWGTPYYYVLDEAGRIRFDVSTSADEALARAEALRIAVERRTAAR